MSTSSRVSDAESVAADRLMSLAALFEQKSKPAAKDEPPAAATGSSMEAKPQPQHVDSCSSKITKKSPGTSTSGNDAGASTTASTNPKSTAGVEKKSQYEPERHHAVRASNSEDSGDSHHSPVRATGMAPGTTSTTAHPNANGRSGGSGGSSSSSWVRHAMMSTLGNSVGVPTATKNRASTADSPSNYNKTSTTNNTIAPTTSAGPPESISSSTYMSNSPKKFNKTSGAGTMSGNKSANKTAAEAKKLDTDQDRELPKSSSGGHHHVGSAAVASPERRPSAVGSSSQQQQIHPQLSAPGKDGDRRPSLPRTYFVTHDYVDHANVRCEDVKDFEASIPKRSNRGGVKSLFPEKLHSLLSMGDEHVDPSIISWAPHGRCFSVHNVREFTRELMPRYFNHTAITSFQRQLNLYGFKRITKTGSKDQGAYYHELFLRGRPMLCRRMRRQKIKGTGYKPLPDPDNEPDFYSMEPCYEDDLKDQKAQSDDDSPVLSQIKRGGKFDLASLTGGAGAGVAAAAAAGVGARKAAAAAVLMDQEAHKKAQAQAAIKGDEPPSKKPRTVAGGVSAELSNYLPHNRDILASPRQGGSLGSDAASQVLRQAAVRNAAAASQAGAASGGQPESPYGSLGGGRGGMGMVPTSPTSMRANAALHSRLQATLAASAAAPAHAQDSSQVVLEQLLSRVYGGGGGGASGAGGRGGGPAPPDIVDSARTSRTALQEEIEMLEATRRNVMLQQQRLEMLLGGPGGSAGGAAAARAGLGGPPPPPSAASQQHSYHLGQLAAAYDGASSGPPPPSRGEQLARTLAGLDRAAVGSPGAEGGEGGASRPALVKALEDLLAAGRISNEQLAGIESILGRPAAPQSTAALQQQQQSSALSGLAARYGRNGWI